MMLRKRRRPILYVSDSSDDDSQSRKVQRTRLNRCSNATNISQQSRSDTQEVTDEESDSHILHAPRKKCKSRRLYSSDEVESTEDEDIVHPARHGSIRALSDYESGTNSDSSSGAATAAASGEDGLEVGISIHVGEQNIIPTNSGVFVAEYSDQNGYISESSTSNSSIIQSTQYRRRPSNVIYSSDSSESDIPTAVTTLQRRYHNRILSTDNENNSNNTSGFSRNRTEQFSSDYSQNEFPTQYETVRQQITLSGRQEARNNIHSSIQIGIRNNGGSGSDNDSSSNSEIVFNNNSFRNRNRFRITVSAFNEESSSTDSDEHVVIRNRVRRATVLPLNESDDDDEISTTDCRNESNEASQTHEKSTMTSSCQGHSSDSDCESEKCAICLGRFNQQEVGVPSSCEHCFCLVCIKEWAKNNNTCPIDRKKFNMLIIYDKAHGKIKRRIPVENPPLRSFEESAELWESVAAEIMFTVQQINADENNDDSSGEEDDDDDDEICGICEQGNNVYSAMIECDDCNSTFHMSCVRLDSIPVSSWFCRDCSLY